MRRRILAAVASGMLAVLVVIACAKAPETRTNATPESSVDAGAGAGNEGDGHVPGLPMPQQFPRLAWDAAGFPRDAAAR